MWISYESFRKTIRFLPVRAPKFYLECPSRCLIALLIESSIYLRNCCFTSKRKCCLDNDARLLRCVDSVWVTDVLKQFGAERQILTCSFFPIKSLRHEVMDDSPPVRSEALDSVSQCSVEQVQNSSRPHSETSEPINRSPIRSRMYGNDRVNDQ